MELFISVVVCTYNHSNLLKNCIASLCAQTLNKEKYEIIVVDNNSKDDTAEVVKAFENDELIRYVFEERQGLSHARNRGVSEASGNYIAFIDDDAKAAPNWLEVAYEILDSTQPALDCLGGPYHPLYLSQKPKWFLDKYEIRGFGDSQKYLNAHEMLSGSNMIWLKDSLTSIGQFNENFGVIGKQLKLGEETDAFEKLWSLNGQAQILFAPNLIIYHLVPEFKMSVGYRLKRKFAQGQYHAQKTIVDVKNQQIIALFQSIVTFLKSSIRFLFKIFSHKYWQNWIVEDGGVVVYHFGKMLGCLGVELKVSQRN